MSIVQLTSANDQEVNFAIPPYLQSDGESTDKKSSYEESLSPTSAMTTCSMNVQHEQAIWVLPDWPAMPKRCYLQDHQQWQSYDATQVLQHPEHQC